MNQSCVLLLIYQTIQVPLKFMRNVCCSLTIIRQVNCFTALERLQEMTLLSMNSSKKQKKTQTKKEKFWLTTTWAPSKEPNGDASATPCDWVAHFSGSSSSITHTTGCERVGSSFRSNSLSPSLRDTNFICWWELQVVDACSMKVQFFQSMVR